MAAGATLNPRVRSLSQALDLSKRAVEAATELADFEYRRQEVQTFATEGGSGGQRWQELSEPYRTRKAKKYPGRKILVLTGAMRKAFANQGEEHIAESFRVSRWTIRLGAQGPSYYRFHAEGTPRMPQRDPQQRTNQQSLALRAAVARGLEPYVLASIRAHLGATGVEGLVGGASKGTL